MILIECPWCDAPIEAELAAPDARLRCEACRIAVEIAPDEIPAMPVAAAA